MKRNLENLRHLGNAIRKTHLCVVGIKKDKCVGKMVYQAQ